MTSSLSSGHLYGYCSAMCFNIHMYLKSAIGPLNLLQINSGRDVTNSYKCVVRSSCNICLHELHIASTPEMGSFKVQRIIGGLILLSQTADCMNSTHCCKQRFQDSCILQSTVEVCWHLAVALPPENTPQTLSIPLITQYPSTCLPRLYCLLLNLLKSFSTSISITAG